MVTSPEEQELIDRLRKLRPDLIVVPRVASSIMLLRGSQHGPVFEAFDNGSALDYVYEYMDFREAPKDKRWDPDPNDYLHEDPRQYALVAAAWKGCISGFEEWQRYRAQLNPTAPTNFVDSWDSPPKYLDPLLLPTPDYLKKEPK